MAFISVLRDGENLSEAVLQRELAIGLSDCPVVPGVGTGYSSGMIGKMNGAAGANPNHFSVQANGTTLVLTVQPGWMYVVKDAGASSYDPRIIMVICNAALTLTLANNSQGTSRTDTICLRFDQTIAPDPTGSNLPTVVPVTGGASNALGNAPGDGALYVPLANVVIANGATSVAQGVVTDRRMTIPIRSFMSSHISASQVAIANGVSTAITGLTADIDGNGTFSAASWTCTLPGWYTVSGAINVQSTAAVGQVFIYQYINGVIGTIVRIGGTCPCTTGGSEPTIGALVKLTYGDVVSFAVSASPGVGQTSNTVIGTSHCLSINFENFS